MALGRKRDVGHHSEPVATALLPAELPARRMPSSSTRAGVPRVGNDQPEVGRRIKVTRLIRRAGRRQGETHGGERHHMEVVAGPRAKQGLRGDADEQPGHRRTSGKRRPNGGRARNDLTSGLLPGVGGDDAYRGYHGDHGGGHDGGGGGSVDSGGHGGARMRL